MSDSTRIPLVSSEISAIWNSYLGENISECVFKYYSNKVDDDDIKDILLHALELSSQRINALTEIFTQEKLPIPEKFTDKDVNINAPRLFTDTFYLQYLLYISGASAQYYSTTLRCISRTDIRGYISNCILEATDLFNRAAEISLSKGVLVRSPRIEIPKEVQYIKSEGFMMDLFGKKRAMLTDEITNIFAVINENTVRKAILTGFYQVCKNKKVSNCLESILDYTTKESNTFTALLESERVPIGSSYDSYVTDSTIPPFSDKFILNKIMIMHKIKANCIGGMIADLERSDLVSTFMKQLNESVRYGEDIASVLIECGWFQQAPQAINHKNLVEV